MSELSEKFEQNINATPSNPLHNVLTNAPNQNDEEKLTPGRKRLRSWLGRVVRIVITDGRVLVGFLNCTDRDANIVLSVCAEYLVEGKDERLLGNVMVPGRHIVSISLDLPSSESTDLNDSPRLSSKSSDTLTPDKAETTNTNTSAAEERLKAHQMLHFREQSKVYIDDPTVFPKKIFKKCEKGNTKQYEAKEDPELASTANPINLKEPVTGENIESSLDEESSTSENIVDMPKEEKEEEKLCDQ